MINTKGYLVQVFTRITTVIYQLVNMITLESQLIITIAVSSLDSHTLSGKTYSMCDQPLQLRKIFKGIMTSTKFSNETSKLTALGSATM